MYFSSWRCFGVLFFFFQAEAGIRDWSVTGVQTCALPICMHELVEGVEKRREGRRRKVAQRGQRQLEQREFVLRAERAQRRLELAERAARIGAGLGGHEGALALAGGIIPL